MREDVLKKAEQYRAAKRRKQRLHRWIGALSCVALLVTVTALTKTAITAENNCVLEEHAHSEACYRAETVGTVTFSCKDTLHEHDEKKCYDDEGNLTCGKMDFFVHEHNQDCYDSDGTLFCPLEEIEEHQHTSECYETAQILTCGKEESAGHTHSDSCYESQLTCDDESDEHQHSDACYTTTLVCGQEESEGHTHSDSCYTQQQGLTCDKVEATVHKEHTDDCVDANGVYNCGLPIVINHVHSADCMTTVEKDEQVLTCDLAEHTHGDGNCQSKDADEAVVLANTASDEDYSSLWSDMTDEEFVDWVTGSEHDDYLLKIFEDVKNGDDTLESLLSDRMDAIFENTEDYEAACELYSQVQSHLDALWGTNTDAETLETATCECGNPNGIGLTAADFYSSVMKDNSNVSRGLNSYIEDNYGDDVYHIKISGGKYHLEEDFSIAEATINESGKKDGKYIEITGDTTIDLNGYVLNGTGDYCVIYVSSGELVIEDSKQYNTTNNVHYGSISSTYTNLWVWDSTITNTTDEYKLIKGGIITGGGTTNTSTGTDQHFQTGIYVKTGCSLTMNGGTVAGNKHNTPKSGAGAGIVCMNNSNVELNDVTICYNYSRYNGGGLYASGTVTLNNCYIQNNYAEAYGGGIRISDKYACKLEINGGEVSGNYAGKQGGGIEVSMGHVSATAYNKDDVRTAKFDGVKISNNTAGYSGGGISMTEEVKVGTVYPGVYLTVTGSTTISGNKALGNDATDEKDDVATGRGGGIYLEFGTLTIESGTIGGTDSSGKSTPNTVDGDGGGFYVASGTFVIESGTISNNTATGSGGGGYVSATADGDDVKLYGGTFSGNTAALNGGGLVVKGTADALADVYAGFEKDDENKLASRTSSTTSEPAAADDDEEETTTTTTTTTTTSTAVTFTDNTASTGNGGGIYLEYASFILNDASVSSNHAENWNTLNSLDYGNGGGIYIKNSAFKMSGGTVEGNWCTRFGGGVYIYSPEKTSIIEGGKIQSNKAAQCGGGIAIYKSVLTMGGGTIDGNIATQGGGVYARWNGAILTLTDGTISNNHAHSMTAGDTHTSDGVSEFFTKISQARTDGRATSLTFSTSNTDNNPDSGGNGGGVFIVNAELVMHGGTITGNSAGRNGGGIYVVHSNSKSTSDQSDDTDDTAASVTIDAGTISGNTAEKRGGAVSMDTYDWKYYDADGNVTSGGDGTFQSAGCGLTSSDAALTVTFTGESLIAKNEAEDGGGFYVGGGKLTVDGGVIRYNTASATQDEIDKANDGYKLTTAYDANKNIGVGGGIYVYHAGTLVLNSSGASGVYSNTASFAADDLYCSRASNSEISIPDVTDMALEDYKGNVVGHAIGWYEDYPKDDTYYSNRDTTYVDSDQLVLKEGESVIRYRVALAYYLAHLDVDADSVEGRRVLYNVSKDHLTTVNGYVALTLGYELTRYDLTVKKMVDSDDTDAPSPGEFTFTVTITGAVAESDLTAKDSYGNFYETAKLHIYPNDSKYSIDHDEQDEREADGTVTKKGYATVTFKLKAGESVTLEGIPVGAKVVVTEEKTANYVAKYTTEGGKELSGSSTYTIDQIDGNTSIVCVNTLVYTLPSTGGSGTLIYTISGMVLCATAVVFWNRRRRRAH